MKEHEIERIPIAEIRIANPRSRSQIKFQLIVSSIKAVGLKRPITACRRELDQDGTRYDLVCGQGRLIIWQNIPIAADASAPFDQITCGLPPASP